MEIKLYDRLSTRSKRAFKRKNGAGGRPFYYRPRITLLLRLAAETGLTVEQVQDRLMEERRDWLRQTYGGVL